MMGRGIAWRRTLSERRYNQVLRHIRREYAYHRAYCLSDALTSPWKYTRRISIDETETIEVVTQDDYETYVKASARKRRDNAAYCHRGWGGSPRYSSSYHGAGRLTVQERISLTQFQTNIHVIYDL